MDYSVYLGKRSHQTYYIGHSFSDGLTVRAFLANDTNPFRPLRELVGTASFAPSGDQQVWSRGSHVMQSCRRDGLLSAMYDHVEANGYRVVPADGSTGEAQNQVQSQDGKAFWAARSQETRQSPIQPCSEREFAGWDNPFRDANKALGEPVRQKLNIEGYPNPMLVLWGRHFTGEADQRVGVTYRDQQGYAVMVLIGDPEGEHCCDVPQQRGGRLRFLNGEVTQKMRASTNQEVLRLNSIVAQSR